MQLPDFKFLSDNANDTLAADEKLKINLNRAAESIKNDKVILSGLSEAILSEAKGGDEFLSLTLARSHLNVSSTTQDGPSTNAAAAKEAKYSDLPNAYAFKSLGLESLGPICSSGTARSFYMNCGVTFLW